MKNNKKLNPFNKTVLDQMFQLIKVSISQFKKTPNMSIAILVRSGCKNLETEMDKYIVKYNIEKNKKIKVNGV